jgi:hypothetical protein
LRLRFRRESLNRFVPLSRPATLTVPAEHGALDSTFTLGQACECNSNAGQLPALQFDWLSLADQLAVRPKSFRAPAVSPNTPHTRQPSRLAFASGTDSTTKLSKISALNNWLLATELPVRPVSTGVETGK